MHLYVEFYKYYVSQIYDLKLLSNLRYMLINEIIILIIDWGTETELIIYFWIIHKDSKTHFLSCG